MSESSSLQCGINVLKKGSVLYERCLFSMRLNDSLIIDVGEE